MFFVCLVSGSEQLRAKDNQPVEQVTSFKFLGCDISHRGEVDIDHKLTNFNRMNGTIARTLGGKASKQTMIKFYKTMSIPSLMYGSETWTVTKYKERKITSAEMRFLRKVQGVTLLDYQRSDAIRNSLKLEPVNQLIRERRDE